MPISPKKKKRPWEMLPTLKYHERLGRYPAAQKFYKSATWLKLRNEVLIDYPFCQCEKCQASGNPLPANVVDHVDPINHHDPYDTKNGRYGEPLDKKNLMAMNNVCHNRKTAKENAFIYKRRK